MLVAAVATVAVDIVVVVFVVVFFFLLVLLVLPFTYPFLGRWEVLRVDRAATFARRSLFLRH